MDAVDRPVREDAGRAHGVGKGRSDRLHDRPDEHRAIGRDFDAAGAQQRRDPGGHVAGIAQRRMIRIEQRHLVRHRGGAVEQGRQVDRRAVLGFPRPHALAEQPEAGDVVQESDAAVDAELVGEVRLACGIRQHRLIEFQTDQPPVPQEMYAECGDVRGAATTADAVSCEPTPMTGRSAPTASTSSGRSLPITSPAFTSSGSTPAGMPSRDASSRSHSDEFTASSPVVDAFVRSATHRPVRR